MSQATFVLGTAGHIDHGKTSLVRALTGVDTDRLPQEKERGMTIDIGFAELPLEHCRLGIIDVPGHERFIKNMLAGASTVDMALLVVAADDSVMPQTREHLEILNLLGVRHGAIAITKCDQRDEGWLEVVSKEIREVVAGTGLADAPIIRTAVPPKGPPQGLDELRAALDAAALQVQQRPLGELFRLCVDRSFTVAGRGTVVTGTVSTGQLQVGEQVEWLPGGERLQVRGLHNHGRPAEAVQRGQRAAVNLAGVHHRGIERGDVLATPDYLVASRRLTVELRALADSRWPIKHRSRYTLHLRKKSEPARVALIQAATLEPSQQGLAQILPQEPVAAVWGQPFVLRHESPVATIGGGRILQPVAAPIRNRQLDLIGRLADLQNPDAAVRLAAAVFFQGHQAWRELDLCRDSGLSAEQVRDLLAQLEQQQVCLKLRIGPHQQQLVHRDVVEQLAESILRNMDRCHLDNPLWDRIPRSHVYGRLRMPRPWFDAVFDHLLATGRLVGDHESAAKAGCKPKLTARQRQYMASILEAYAKSDCQPPMLSELSGTLVATARDVELLVELAAAQGHLKHLGGELYLDASTEQSIQSRLREAFGTRPQMTVSEIRDVLSTTRKYAVPICEYLDRMGVTVRDGDQRRLGS